MKLTLHPGSAIAGAVLVAVPLILMSAQTEAVWPRQVPIPVTVKELPDPLESIIIRADTPYIVPVGKALVVETLVKVGINGGETEVYIDGVREYHWSHGPLLDLPQALVVRAGSTIETKGFNNPQAWGYLVDA